MKKHTRTVWSETHSYAPVLPKDAKVWLARTIEDHDRNETRLTFGERNSFNRDLVSWGTNVETAGLLVDFLEQDPREIIENQKKADIFQKCLRCRQLECRCLILRDLTYMTDDYIRPMYNEDIAIRNSMLNTAVQKLRLEVHQTVEPVDTFSVGQRVILHTFQHLDTHRGNPVLRHHSLRGKCGTVAEYCGKRKQYQVKVWHSTSYIHIWLGSAELKGAHV